MSGEVIVLSDSESSEDEQNKKSRILIEKLEEQSRFVNPSGTYVYVLTVESYDHSAHYGQGPENKIVGIFNSKEAAISMSGSCATFGYGTFDEALIEFRESYGVDGYDPIDNRGSSPDEGILIQVGDRDCGEGDYSSLIITKKPVLGLTETQNPKVPVKKKRRYCIVDRLCY